MESGVSSHDRPVWSSGYSTEPISETLFCEGPWHDTTCIDL